MKFAFHIGTEKTGSSFLQSLCALGREELARQGIWFPWGSAYDERCMVAGKISAGNGRDLAQRIPQKQWGAVRDEMRKAAQSAQHRGCSTVLLSSEWLLAAFAERARLHQFTAILSELDAERIQFLLILRDPVGQFLSLYKHRAKNGADLDIAEWGPNSYRLPYKLAGLRNSLRHSSADLVVRQFRREPGGLEEIFFNQWLGVRTPEAALPETVNPSLSLSELELLRMLAQRRPSLVVPLYDRLLAIDLKEKVQGHDLDAYARAIAERAVAAHRDEWVAWNQLLPASEQLVIPQPEGDIPTAPLEVGFSRTQMEALMGFLGESVGPRFLLQLLWSSRIRPVLGRVKRLLLPGIKP